MTKESGKYAPSSVISIDRNTTRIVEYTYRMSRLAGIPNHKNTHQEAIMTTNRGVIQVLSPEYCSTITEAVTIRLRVTQDIGALTAYCAKANASGDDYEDSVVARVQPDAEGLASFQFHAEEYPHGPITIRICGGEGDFRDICHLQLYNKAGKPFLQGADAAPIPPFAKGMKQVFLDDFSDPDLSISTHRSDVRYYCHKPGG